MKKVNDILLALHVIGFVSYFGFTIFVNDDRAVSDVENRTLSQQPEFEWETVVNGEYMKEFESYITDQFNFRDAWIKGYLKWQLLTNQTYIFDYYIQDDWVYPEPFTEVDEKAVRFAADQMSNLNEFAKENDIELYFFSLPDRRYMLEVDYPKSIPDSVGQADKEMFFSLVPNDHLNMIDVDEVWDYDQEELRSFYYRTDHHWNMDGAFAAYEVIRNELYESSNYFSDSKFDRDDYKKECITDKDFLGGYNKQLYRMMDTSDEPMCYYTSKDSNQDEWTTYVKGMKESNKKESLSSIYGRAKNSDEELVTYSDVYTTDYSEIHIINPAKADSNSKVLFLKDSYANPLLPLLAEHFYQTSFYDVRHNKGEKLYEFIQTHDFDTIVFLYSNGRTLEYLYEFGERP